MKTRLPICLMMVVALAACSDKISDVSSTGSLAPAIGQCIEVKLPILVFARKEPYSSDLLMVLREGGVVSRPGGEAYPSGSKFRIDRMITVEAFDGGYFFVEGILLDRPHGARINLAPLINFEWVSASAARVEAGELPVLPPTMRVPLDSSVAGDCDPVPSVPSPVSTEESEPKEGE
jgi:hypothetical protein